MWEIWSFCSYAVSISYKKGIGQANAAVSTET